MAAARLVRRLAARRRGWRDRGRGRRRDDAPPLQRVEPLVEVEVGRVHREPDLVDRLSLARELQDAAVDAVREELRGHGVLVDGQRGGAGRELGPERLPGGGAKLGLALEVGELHPSGSSSSGGGGGVSSTRKIPESHTNASRSVSRSLMASVSRMTSGDTTPTMVSTFPSHLRLLLRLEGLRELLLGDVAEVHEQLAEVLARIVRGGADRHALHQEDGLVHRATLAGEAPRDAAAREELDEIPEGHEGEGAHESAHRAECRAGRRWRQAAGRCREPLHHARRDERRDAGPERRPASADGGAPGGRGAGGRRVIAQAVRPRAVQAPASAPVAALPPPPAPQPPPRGGPYSPEQARAAEEQLLAESAFSHPVDVPAPDVAVVTQDGSRSAWPRCAARCSS